MINEAGDSGSFPAAIRIPEDSDLSNSTILAAGFEDAADRTAYLKAATDAHDLAMGSQTTKSATTNSFGTNSLTNELIDELVFNVQEGDKLEVLVGPLVASCQGASGGVIVVRIVDGVSNYDHETVTLGTNNHYLTIPVWHTVMNTGSIRVQLMHRANNSSYWLSTSILMATIRWCFAKISRPQ
jgi:hypothetical protein